MTHGIFYFPLDGSGPSLYFSLYNGKLFVLCFGDALFSGKYEATVYLNSCSLFFPSRKSPPPPLPPPPYPPPPLYHSPPPPPPPLLPPPPPPPLSPPLFPPPPARRHACLLRACPIGGCSLCRVLVSFPPLSREDRARPPFFSLERT